MGEADAFIAKLDCLQRLLNEFIKRRYTVYEPMSNPNIKSMVERLREIGLTDEDVTRRFRRYDGVSEYYGEVARL